MRSRLLVLIVLSIAGVPIAATSGPVRQPAYAHGAGVLPSQTAVSIDVEERLLIPIVCPTQCPAPVGQVTLYPPGGEVWNASVECIAGTGREVFLGLSVLNGDILLPAAAYVRPGRGELGLRGNRFGLMRDVRFDCHNDRIRTALRMHAQPLFGRVETSNICEVCV